MVNAQADQVEGNGILQGFDVSIASFHTLVVDGPFHLSLSNRTSAGCNNIQLASDENLVKSVLVKQEGGVVTLSTKQPVLPSARISVSLDCNNLRVIEISNYASGHVHATKGTSLNVVCENAYFAVSGHPNKVTARLVNSGVISLLSVGGMDRADLQVINGGFIYTLEPAEHVEFSASGVGEIHIYRPGYKKNTYKRIQPGIYERAIGFDDIASNSNRMKFRDWGRARERMR
ncbi:GIN domain-containing protein [Ketobacter sp.]|uniref:GIN domain-containing protein n=1 Tax=Ketobacter sp. TaxID=2083498 RepID=UPI000F287017|nr:DUF2807 domain-containing protein [Ketobacter sp.]RLT99279.1 MAG: hypothetical protein D9N14_09060 [Ketobacter sp.]